MSSNSNLRTARRRLLGLLAVWPLSGLAGNAGDLPLAGLQRWGSGQFRRFGFLVYDATLWAGDADSPQAPLALNLTYRRNIDGLAIAEASVKEMRQLGMADEATLRQWGARMAALFPDVRPGDQILGLYRPEGASFYFNDRRLGSIDEPGFARAFFAIWLDPKTSAPELRAALLKRTAR